MKIGKYTIKKVGNIELKDYAGMNYYAAKDIHWTPCPSKNEIWIDKKLPKNIQFRTIKHEISEIQIMKKNGFKYGNAHKKSLRREKLSLNKIMQCS